MAAEMANAIGLDDGRVVAEEAHPVLAVAHGHQQPARAGCGRAARRPGRPGRARPPRRSRRSAVCAGSLRSRPKKNCDVGQAVGAAGEPLLADQQDHEGGGQRLGEDREVRAAHPLPEHQQAQHAAPPAVGSTHHHGQREHRVAERLPQRRQLSRRRSTTMKSGRLPGAGVDQLQVHAHRVAAEAEEHALAEGEHAAVPPGQVDADRDDREAEVLAPAGRAGTADSVSGRHARAAGPPTTSEAPPGRRPALSALTTGPGCGARTGPAGGPGGTRRSPRRPPPSPGWRRSRTRRSC